MANEVQTQRASPVKAFTEEIRQPAYMKEFSQLLPEGVDPNRFTRSVVTAVTADPTLLNCDRKSLFFAIRKAAQLGLDCSGVGGEGWLVQVNKKGQQAKNVEYWIGYRGHIKLARQSGEISSFECEIIHENDHVIYRGGITPVFEVEFNWQDPGEPVAVYAVARFKDGGHQLKVMGKHELTEIKTRAIGNRRYTPWHSDEAAMWRKTCLHRLCALLPTSTTDNRMADGIQHEIHEETSGLDTRALPAPEADEDDDATERKPRRRRKTKAEKEAEEQAAQDVEVEPEPEPETPTEDQRTSRMDAVANAAYSGGGEVVAAEPDDIMPDDGDPGPDEGYDPDTGEVFDGLDEDDDLNDVS